MRVVGHNLFEFAAGKLGSSGGQVERGQLDAGPRVGMAFEDAAPGVDRVRGSSQCGVGLGEGHEGVAVVVAGFPGTDLLEVGQAVVRPAQAEQALAEVGEGIEVVRIAVEGGAVAGFGLGQFALLEVDVAELGMVVGFVEVMDLCLEFPDATAVVGAGQLEPPDTRSRLPIDQKEIEGGVQHRKDENEHRPQVLLAAQGIHKHPDRKRPEHQEQRVVPVQQVAQEAKHHPVPPYIVEIVAVANFLFSRCSPRLQSSQSARMLRGPIAIDTAAARERPAHDMSTAPEFELDLDLQLLPAWARQPSTDNRYSKYEGDAESDARGRRGPRFGRFDPNRDRGPRRDRPPGGPGQGRPPGRPPGAPGDRPAGPRFGPRRGPLPPRTETEEPKVRLPEVEVSLLPEEKGVESLARQIKLTGRAYPLFDIAGLVLRRPDKFHIRFEAVKTPEGQVRQPLLVCTVDESLWLSEDDLVAHALRHHFDIFYQTEKVATEPPKGTYTFVAQCGLSGIILGPPNFHDYQQKLRKLHAERYGRMPFDVYKSRVRIVRDEAVVKQWVEEQSWKMEYVCLNVPEPVKLPNRDEVEKHFRSTHLPNLVRSDETYTLVAGAKRPAMSAGLHAVLRQAVEDQKRFPLKLATVLSQMFAAHGLQFFKVNRTVTHVCVARPHYLDLENTVVSDGVRRIVEFINAHHNCTRRSLLAALAPTPPTPLLPVPTVSAQDLPPAPAPAAATPAVEAPTAATPPPSAPATPEAPAPTPEQTAVIADLHWLIHQGHVIEYTTGKLETAKAPKPRPVQPPPPAPTTDTTPPSEPGAVTADQPATPAVPAVPAVPSGAETPATVVPEAEAGVAPADQTPTTSPEPAAEATVTTPPAPAAAPVEPPTATQTGLEQ